MKCGIAYPVVRPHIPLRISRPFATVERYGNWYYSRGREKDKGPHTAKPQWGLFTRDRDLALREARSRIEG